MLRRSCSVTFHPPGTAWEFAVCLVVLEDEPNALSSALALGNQAGQCLEVSCFCLNERFDSVLAAELLDKAKKEHLKPL